MTTLWTFRLAIQGLPDVQEFPIPLGISQIGRQVGNQLVLPDNQVSRQHARLECTQMECYLVDLGSSNGTYHNGEKLAPQTPVLLRQGDKIKIGPFEIGFLQEEQVIDQAETPPEPENMIVEKTPPQKSADPMQVQAQKGKQDPQIPIQPPPPPDDGSRSTSAAASEPVFPLDGSLYSQKLIHYLPGIYHTDFMSRFLGLFEFILTPIEWTVDNFDLFLAPGTAPYEFLIWLQQWFALPPTSNWSDAQQRAFLKEAHKIYARRGTKWALSRILEIHCDCQPEIQDMGEKLEPFTFIIQFPLRKDQLELETLSAIIDSNKPAYTTYRLEFS